MCATLRWTRMRNDCARTIRQVMAASATRRRCLRLAGFTSTAPDGDGRHVTLQGQSLSCVSHNENGHDHRTAAKLVYRDRIDVCAKTVLLDAGFRWPRRFAACQVRDIDSAVAMTGNYNRPAIEGGCGHCRGIGVGIMWLAHRDNVWQATLAAYGCADRRQHVKFGIRYGVNKGAFRQVPRSAWSRYWCKPPQEFHR